MAAFKDPLTLDIGYFQVWGLHLW